MSAIETLGVMLRFQEDFVLLEEELKKARKEVVTDGYDMSIGEIVNLYRDGELLISPDFQRYFRWDISRKSKFVESILLGIPIPPIFVSQNSKGAWELVDGLQRISTLLEFMGELHDENGKPLDPLSLEGTKALPSLAERTWDGPGKALTSAQKLDIKRARMRIEILKRESDPTAKYELFQRLNTGGASLTEQEVRSCTAVMINKEFHEWLVSLSQYAPFLNCLDLTQTATDRQNDLELVIRLLAYRSIPYTPGMDVHEYIDDAVIKMASDTKYPQRIEGEAFKQTFNILGAALGKSAFCRWDGKKFTGRFLISVFEVIATGTSFHLESLLKMTATKRNTFIVTKAKALWKNPIFRSNTGAGVRGSTRLAHILPLAKTHMEP